MRIFAKLTSAFFLAVLLGGGRVVAATLNVGPGQTYGSIQKAIDAAASGDTVLVAPGTYYENIDFKGKAITVLSSAGAGSTTIDGGGSNGPVVFLGTNYSLPPNTPGGPSVLDGFTIQHGSLTNPYSGPPVQAGGVDSQGNSLIQNNVITDNAPYGLEVGPGNTVIRANHILRTQQTAAYGIAAYGGVGIMMGVVTYYPGIRSRSPAILSSKMLETVF